MELIYAIAQELNIPNECIKINQVIDDIVWFSVSSTGAKYSCKTIRGGKYLKKNSIRID